jgi:hypothetical protein
VFALRVCDFSFYGAPDTPPWAGAVELRAGAAMTSIEISHAEADVAKYIAAVEACRQAVELQRQRGVSGVRCVAKSQAIASGAFPLQHNTQPGVFSLPAPLAPYPPPVRIPCVCQVELVDAESQLTKAEHLLRLAQVCVSLASLPGPRLGPSRHSP